MKVDESTTKLVMDMQREVESSPRGNSPEDNNGSELTYNKQLCSILQQVTLHWYQKCLFGAYLFGMTLEAVLGVCP